jgi:hypothetical protein
MLSNTLNTNEIKNAAGTEQEFGRLLINNRETEFSLLTESPSLPHRLSIKHQETGSGVNGRRRSVVRIDKTVMSTVDTTLPVTVSAYMVLDAPVGALVANTEMANTLANLLSFCATTGAATTVLFDGTGNGAVALLSGGL